MRRFLSVLLAASTIYSCAKAVNTIEPQDLAPVWIQTTPTKAYKTVIYLPQVHIDPVDPNYHLEDILNCQLSLYDIIEILHQDYGIDKLAIEGQQGIVGHESLLEKLSDEVIELRQQNPDMLEEDVNALANLYLYVHTGLRYELDAEDSIKTVGVDDIDFNDKTVELIKEKYFLQRMSGSTSMDEQRIEQLDKQIDRYVQKRSQIAASQALQYADPNIILLFGAGHKQNLVELFHDKARLYIITTQECFEAEQKLK